MRVAGWLVAALFAGVLGSSDASAQRTERLYQAACDDGDLIACNVFGLMYESGDGVPRDMARAAALYRRACEGGALVGCTNLGLLYEVGGGVPRDEDTARGLFAVACEAGEELACASLAELSPATGAAEGFFKLGRVADANTTAPLPGTLIEVPDLGRRVVSDADGRFLIAGARRGTHALRAERAGYELLEGELEVPGEREVLVLLTPDGGADLTDPGRVLGRVTADDGTDLAGVEVTDGSGRPARGLTDSRGRFVLPSVAPGLVELRFTRLGYAPRTAMIVVQPGRTVEVSTTMSTRPIELEPIEVTVRSAYLERNGFYERVGRTAGSHFTRADLEVIDPIDVSDLVRRVPGVALRRFSELDPDRLFAVSRRGMTPGGGPCVLPLWIDGVRSPDPNLNQLLPEQIEAIELYSGISAPAQYTSNGCGVVLVWTVRGSGRDGG